MPPDAEEEAWRGNPREPNAAHTVDAEVSDAQAWPEPIGKAAVDASVRPGDDAAWTHSDARASSDAEQMAPDAGADAATSDAASVDHGECPADVSDMVFVPSEHVYVDRFEASMGSGDRATSRTGAMPWLFLDWRSAGGACRAAGKRLCHVSEWIAACSGPSKWGLPYGDVYHAGACNDYAHDAGTTLPTGSLSACEGGYPGLFDMSGNVWEWVDERSAGGEPTGRVLGGSFETSEPGRMRCDPGEAQTMYAPALATNVVGFRCCCSAR